MTPHDQVPHAEIVTAREHLEEVVEELKRAQRLALDIESNGFYAYRERVCLLQISSPERDFIVDPLAISDLSSLGPLMSDPGIEKIFHAGEYDILCLKRDYGFRFANLFDTMIAGRLLGVKELGLAAAIERHFGVKLSKKLQRADWGLRPLTPAQLRYAQFDTHYLMRLADIQKEELQRKGRAEDSREAFAELAAVEPVPRVFDPEGFWRLSGAQRLSGTQMACLKEIYLFREHQAQTRDRAPFRVMPEELMLRLATSMPENLEALAGVKGMTPYLHRKFGPALLKAVERGRQAQPLAPEALPPRPRRDVQQLKLFEALRQWRKAQAEREGVEPVVVVSSEVLNEIARLALEAGGDPLSVLSPLKRGRYGAQIEQLLKSRKAG